MKKILMIAVAIVTAVCSTAYAQSASDAGKKTNLASDSLEKSIFRMRIEKIDSILKFKDMEFTEVEYNWHDEKKKQRKLESKKYGTVVNFGVEGEGFVTSKYEPGFGAKTVVSNTAVVGSSTITSSSPADTSGTSHHGLLPYGDFGLNLSLNRYTSFYVLSYRFVDHFVRLESNYVLCMYGDDAQVYTGLTLAKSAETNNLWYAGVSLGERFKVDNAAFMIYAEGGIRNRVTDNVFFESGIKLQILAAKHF